MNGVVSAPAPLAYLVKRFPRLSETFILREILELERQGAHVTVFSIMRGADRLMHKDAAVVAERVVYLPSGFAAVLPMVRAHARLFRRAPRRYTAALGEALRRRQKLASLKHFVRAGWLACALEAAGVRHLHAHFAHGPASVAHFASMLGGLPFSFTAHAKDIYTTPRDLLARKIKAAEFVVTCTDYNRDYLSALAGDTAVHRIHHGIDLRLFPSAGLAVPAQSVPTILSVGRLVDKKGFTYLIEAVRLLVHRGIRVQLVIVGDGDGEKALRACIRDAGLTDCVTLRPAMRQEELIAIYRSATLFALPCVVMDDGDRDGIPNVLVEAMRIGLPVVSTDVSGIPELVIDGDSGVLVRPRDASALADAMALLLRDPESRARLADNGARRVIEHFDLRANTAELKRLFAGAGAV